jgi:hypothetical protein
MSIAEMITQGTKQQSQNWSVLSENLGRLGQQVGQQLAMREYQKQAAEALPAMQAAYRSAMDDVSRGSVSEGYRKFMDAQFQFGGSQNPFISNQNKLVSEIFMEGAAAYEKQQQRKAQYGGGGVGGGRGASLLDMYSGGDQLDVDGGELPIDGGFDASVGGEGANLIAEDLGTGFGAGTTGNFAFQMEGYQRPSKEIETTANKEFDQYSSGDAASQESYRTSVMSPQVPKGTEFVEQPGLNRFKGFEQVTGIFVPKEKAIDFPNYSVRKDGKGAISETLTFNKKTINEEQRKKSTELAYNDLPTAIGRISSNQALEKYFIENKVEDLDIGSEKDDLGEVSYYIGVRGDKESRMPIEQDDYISATVIRKLPSTSRTFGAPLAITQVKEQVAPAATAPAAGGLPAVQAQAPAPAAPEIPEEAAGLQQIVAQGQAAKAGEQAKDTEKRIKDIDAEIKQRSSPYIQGSRIGGGMLPGGYTAGVSSGGRSKTPEEAQADIQKITKLKAEKELLSAKSEGRVFNTVEEAKASKKKFPSGTTIYIGGKPAKVK